MSNHTIVCGAGLTGTNAINELKKTGRDHVIIEMDSQRIETLKSSNENIFLQGDAGDEEVLMAAGIKRAAGLLACLPDDKDNLFMVLTARQLNSNLRIVSECVTPANNPKFFKAGADSVVSPQMIGGLRLVSELIRPSVVSFLDLMLRDQEKNMRIEEVTLSPSSELTGQTLESADLCRRFDLQVLATRSQNEENFVYNPDPKKTLDAGSTLVVLTKSEQFKKLQMLAEGK